MKCLIVTGGTPPKKSIIERYINTAALIIGVDGAADLFFQYDIVPNVLIGDFDTADPVYVNLLKERGAKVISMKPEKNVTDTEAALCYALDKKADDIVILGAVGTRIDHTLSNIMMLIKADKAQAKCRIEDMHNELTVSNKDFILYGNAGQTISILPLTGEICVSATNLKYPLDNLMLKFGSSRGVSNIMQKSKSKISISGGYALIVKSTDNA